MKIRPVVLLCLTHLFSVSVSSQDGGQTNPILFADFNIGHAWGKSGGLNIGAGMHYQWARNLLTVRYQGNARLQSKFASYWVPIPIIEPVSNLDEVAILYGWRHVDDGSAYSFSVGLSRNRFTEYINRSSGQVVDDIYRYWGIPFEANLKFFKRKKKPMTIYYIIPVGPPTGLGQSIGLKVNGTIARNMYMGLSLAFGFGFHKHY
ncbi:MAG: hypothetical protein ACO1OO_11755 [Flavisolibacter sp.]